MKLSVKSSITQRLQLIASGTYSSDDIKLLYVDLRDYSKSGSITREIGDYIAHPQEKDRGISHNRVKEQHQMFIKMADLLSGRIAGRMVVEVKSAFVNQDIINDLIAQLDSNGLLDEQSRADIVGNAENIGLCVITLLQDAVFKIEKKLRLTASVIFVDGLIHLVVEYPVNYKGQTKIVAASVIEGAFQIDEADKGIKNIPKGKVFSVFVTYGKGQIKLIN